MIHEGEHDALYLMFNASTNPVDFVLPTAPFEKRWHLAVDTYRETPQDFFAWGEELLLDNQETYYLGPRSSTILVA